MRASRLSSPVIVVIALLAAAAAAVVTISACGKNPFTPTVADIAGTYSATTFTSTNGGTTTDHLAAGGSLTLTLGSDGATTGRLFVPGGAEGGGDLDADMQGTWTLSGTAVDFAQTADTFVRDMTFSAEPSRLRGAAAFSGTTIRVVLQK